MSEIEAYFDSLKNELQRSYAYASEARKKGFDPECEVEVKIAKDVAARVENIVGPKGVAETIRTMEKNGMAREDISFEIARKIAAGEIVLGTPKELIEQAVRTGLGILTEGVLVAPTEGIAKVSIKINPDGSDFVAVYYSGPIRSAGGTAVALSVVLADIARRVLKIADYRATDTQIERYLEEINMYESRVAHLQYKPSEEDIRHIIKNCPVCIDGDPTEEIEVNAFRNVPGVETNRIRGGTPLVICEGIAQKAAKVLKYTKKLKLGWDYLEKLIKLKKENREEKTIKKDETYLDGLVAGRPVFSYPSRKGGFRLRYGKSRTNSLMAKNVHPAAMIILDNFLAYGTHMKIEYPGKGCVVTGYQEMEPPVVKMKNGDVVKVKTVEEAYAISKDVDQILSLGDMLVPYGDFLKANALLMPSSWCTEWFLKECEAISVAVPGSFDARGAFEFCATHNLPLHPDYTYEWDDITKEQLQLLYLECKKARVDRNNEQITQIIFEDLSAKPILEDLLIEHRVVDGKIILDKEYGFSILATLGILKTNEKQISFDDAITIAQTGMVIDILSKTSGILMRVKSPSCIGARMGRPEKGKERKMDGSPNVLFPTGSQKNRSITKTYKTLRGRDERTVNLELVNRRCTLCKKLTFLSTCEICRGETIIERKCSICNRAVDMNIHCDKQTVYYEKKPIDMIELYESIKRKLEINVEDIKGIKGLSNLERTPELLEKGFLRAKYGVYVFRDGTVRFDASNVPLTHFKPNEAQVSVAKLRSLGYSKDYYGNELTSEDQLVSLKIQDIVIPESNGDYFLQAANFIDDLLVNVYGLAPFYNAKIKEDLIGQLTACLSPHTSAAVLCRIIGFTRANLSYAHPYLISARRRNCFHPETKIRIFDKNGKGSDKKISDLFESRAKDKNKIKRLNTNTEKISVEEEIFVESIDIKTNKIVKKRINCFIRAKAPSYWVEIKLESNKKKIVTPDHNIVYSENNTLKHIEVSNVKLGMFIPVKSGRTYRLEKVIQKREFFENKSAYCLDIESKTKNLLQKTILLSNGMFSIRCDGDEDSVMLLMDTLINFSKHYLTEKRGGTMDAPLVLTPQLDPKEVDDEAHCIEVVNSYPKEFYEATLKYASPTEVKLKTVKELLGTPEQFEIQLTHTGGYIDKGNLRTAYVTFDNMKDKITTQFNLQGKIRAVDPKNAAERLILSHFIPDLYGNLRSFSRQTFRCTSCNESLRRVPLSGKCKFCGGNLVLTINKGGIEKYLEISEKIIADYELPDYLKQRLLLVKKEIRSIFEDEKNKQMGLADFV